MNRSAVRSTKTKTKTQTVTARETFTYPDSVLGDVTVGEGEMVDERHEAVKARPGAFGLPGRATSTARPARTATPKPQPVGDKIKALDAELGTRAATIAKLPSPPIRVGLRTGPATRSVNLWQRARDQIIEGAKATGRDSLETGGVLIGKVGAGGDTVEWAAGPGPSAKRGEASVGFDHGHDLAIGVDWLRRTENYLGECGSWHTHPLGDGTPSEQDLQMFARMREILDARRLTPRYIAVIVTPNRDPARAWRYPTLTAWIVRAGEREYGPQAICERVNLS